MYVFKKNGKKYHIRTLLPQKLILTLLDFFGFAKPLFDMFNETSNFFNLQNKGLGGHNNLRLFSHHA